MKESNNHVLLSSQHQHFFWYGTPYITSIKVYSKYLFIYKQKLEHGLVFQCKDFGY